MKRLKQKHQDKLQKHIESINRKIESEKDKNLYAFTTFHLPFIEDYRISYDSNTDTLKDATALGDILLSGMKDLVSIVAEDALGIKEYKLTENEDTKINEFFEVLEREYPLFVEFDVSQDLMKSIKKLVEKQKTDTPYYKSLKVLQREINDIQEVLSNRQNIQSLLIRLGYKFTRIMSAISLLEYDKVQTCADIQRLEKEAREICEEVLMKAKSYDKGVADIAYLKVDNRRVPTDAV